MSDNNGVMRDKKFLDFTSPLDHKLMMEYLNEFTERYPFMGLSFLGESILGKSIPVISLGEGERGVLYVGAHHGMEWITSIVLLRFINEYCESYNDGRSMFSYNMRYLYESKTVYIIPMLNPDGVDYQINGVDKNNVIYERLIKMNGGSEDFSRWQANARGVDLNHNYNYGFRKYKEFEAKEGIDGGAPTRYSGNGPASEPETAALCNYLRFNENIELLISLHTQGEEIFCGNAQNTLPNIETLAKKISKLCGYRISVAEGAAACGGLSDWCISELRRPSFTLECGKGTNPLPLGDNFKIYADLRHLLFSLPAFI